MHALLCMCVVFYNSPSYPPSLALTIPLPVVIIAPFPTFFIRTLIITSSLSLSLSQQTSHADEEAAAEDEGLDGMAGALARALALRSNVIHQSGECRTFLSPSFSLPTSLSWSSFSCFLFLSDEESGSGEESDDEEWD